MNKKEHESTLLTSPSYREWWEANKERILEEDKARHEADMKKHIANDPDKFMSQYEQ